ncbi:MAG: NAD-dependent epimerase/dehydratase family protein [Oscillospiraceae bacterium]|nr:NAD-dependent epimerase/dehydratase family protein [Oscillospiraceae bacterium]
MQKRVLVIGGSYFVGRVFTMVTANFGEGDYEIHMVNRGRYSYKCPTIHEYHFDRHEAAKFGTELPELDFDAVVDFCAYEPEDIRSVLANLRGKVGQYIYFSTASVYDPSLNTAVKETDALMEPKLIGHRQADYVAKKLLLEQELQAVCGEKNIPYTILRPTFIYGPYNYAPRESTFIKLIVREMEVPCPLQSPGKFNFVYVKDAANAAGLCIGDQRAYNKVFNLAEDRSFNYTTMFAAYGQAIGSAVLIKYIPVGEAMKLDLPFPIDHSELCDGSLFAETFGFTYTPFETGFKNTYDYFSSIFAQDG